MLENPLVIAVCSPKGECQIVDEVVVQLGQPWRGHNRQFKETENGFEGVLQLGCAEVPVILEREIDNGDIVLRAESTGRVGQTFSRRGSLVLINPHNCYTDKERTELVKIITGSVNQYLEREARTRARQPKRQQLAAK